MIKYDKLFEVLRASGHNKQWLRNEKLIGQATLARIQNGTGHLEGVTIDKLCKALDCQPGDLMEYIPDTEQG